LHLISLSLKQVEAKPEGLRPHNTVTPADPHNQTEEWLTNMAAQLPSPKQFPLFTNGTKSETGNKCFAKICSRVPSFCLWFNYECRNSVTACSTIRNKLTTLVYKQLYQNYIQKVAVILFDKRRPKSHKIYSPPTSVTRLQLPRKKTSTGTSTALTVDKHWSTRTRLRPCSRLLISS